MWALQKKLRLVVSGGLAVLFCVFGAGNVRADFYFGSTISSGDPLNLIFSINGDRYNVYRHLNDYLGWANYGGSDQSFTDHWWQEGMDEQMSGPWANRYHTRLNQGNDNGGYGWETWTMAPVHYETLIYCGHASTSFNAARNDVKNTFADRGHATGYTWKDNIPAARQCDGTYVSNDGFFAWIDL